MDKKDRKQIFIYLIFSFGIAWAVWIGSYLLKVPQTVLQLITAISMWAPALAVLITKKLSGNEKVVDYSMKFEVKKNIKPYLVAWFLPFLLAILGGIVYFIVFPKNLDLSYSYLTDVLGVNLPATVSISLIVASQILGAIIYGPFINMFFAFGEEVGWRGFLYPKFNKQFSKAKTHLIMGLIWGIWHTPINMMGHNYGVGYFGYPFTGIVVMCIFTFSTGVILSKLCEKSGTVWTAALAHGSINAPAGIPILFASKSVAQSQIYGPGITGLIPSLVVLLVAIIIIKKEVKVSI